MYSTIRARIKFWMWIAEKWRGVARVHQVADSKRPTDLTNETRSPNEPRQDSRSAKSVAHVLQRRSRVDGAGRRELSTGTTRNLRHCRSVRQRQDHAAWPVRWSRFTFTRLGHHQRRESE